MGLPNGSARPDRNSIRDRIEHLNDVDDVKTFLRDLVHGVKFHNDDTTSDGQQSIGLSSNMPIDSGNVLRNVCTEVTAAGGNANPLGTGGMNAIGGGLVNQPLPGPLVAPDTSPESGSSRPTVTPILRGFPNYKFAPTDGHTRLDNPEYSSVIPQQELMLPVKIGDKIKYARLALHDTPDVAVPRPLIGTVQAPPAANSWGGGVTYNAGDRATGSDGNVYISRSTQSGHAPPNGTYWTPMTTGEMATENSQCINALTQMHNDLVQSILAMGLLRPVPRENDKIDWTIETPS